MAKYLFVDDEPGQRDSFMWGIAPGFPRDEFVVAASYDEAVKILETQGPFDGIVSDYLYPGKNPGTSSGGLDLLEYVQTANPTLPLVFYSSTAIQTINREMQARGLSLPADHIFAKPFDAEKAVEFLIRNYGPAAPGGSTPTSTPQGPAKGPA